MMQLPSSYQIAILASFPGLLSHQGVQQGWQGDKLPM